MSDRRTSYKRAVEGFDEEFRWALVDEIMATIVRTSRVTDVDTCVLRTGETAAALVDALAMILTLSPAALRSPTALRRLCDGLHKRLRQRVATGQGRR